MTERITKRTAGRSRTVVDAQLGQFGHWPIGSAFAAHRGPARGGARAPEGSRTGSGETRVSVAAALGGTNPDASVESVGMAPEASSQPLPRNPGRPRTSEASAGSSSWIRPWIEIDRSALEDHPKWPRPPSGDWPRARGYRSSVSAEGGRSPLGSLASPGDLVTEVGQRQSLSADRPRWRWRAEGRSSAHGHRGAPVALL